MAQNSAGLDAFVQAAKQGGQPQGNLAQTPGPLSGLGSYVGEQSQQSQAMQALSSAFGNNMAGSGPVDVMQAGEDISAGISEKDIQEAQAAVEQAKQPVMVDAVAGREQTPYQVETSQGQVDLRKYPLALLGATQNQTGPNNVTRQGKFQDVVYGTGQALPGQANGLYFPEKSSPESAKRAFPEEFVSQVNEAAGDVSDTMVLARGGDQSAVAPHEFRHRAFNRDRAALGQQPRLMPEDYKRVRLGDQTFSEEEFMRLMDAATKPTQADEAQQYFDAIGRDINVEEFVNRSDVNQDILKMQEGAAKEAQQEGAPAPYTHFDSYSAGTKPPETEDSGLLQEILDTFR